MRCVLVVLGAAVWSGGRPSPTLARRINRTAALWQTGEFDIVIASGGLGRHPPIEAKVIRDMLCREGVPTEVIRCEEKATTTFETVQNVAAMLAGKSIEHVHAVTDRSHALRTWIAFRAHGLPVRIRTTAGTGPQSALSVQIQQWLREFFATPYYAIRGAIVLLRRWANRQSR